MRHGLASVALLALVVSCDSTGAGTADDAGNSTTTTQGTRGAGMSDGVSASVTGTTGNSSSSGSGDVGTITGGQVGGEGAFGGSGGESAFGGSGGEGGGDREDGIAGEAGAPNYPEDPYPALAMTRAQRQALLEAGGAVSTTGSVQDDADDLWVVIADTPMVCTEFPPFPACGGHWKVDFMLPRSMQQVGTYELEWFGASYSAEAEDPDMPDVCGGGGGSGSIDGRIVEVLEIDASEIRFRLHSDPWFIDDDINGIYTVPLCPR